MAESKYMREEFTEEQLDHIIKERIVNANPHNRTKGMGHQVTKWKDYEIEARRQIILDLFKKGYSRNAVGQEIRRRWEIKETASRRYIDDALESLKENRESYIQSNREIQTERLEGVLQDCIENKDYKNALKALDQLNKIGGIYSEEKNLNVAGEISFDFGSEE